MNLFKWKHIGDLDNPGAIYLSRLMLFKTKLLGIYVHIIRVADYARCEHNHPWPFLTIILRGGYVEEIDGKEYTRRPGYIGWRPRGFQHRITQLRKDSALTLVIRGPDRVDWHFKTIHGWMHWSDYIKLDSVKRVLWCDDSLGETKRAELDAKERA